MNQTAVALAAIALAAAAPARAQSPRPQQAPYVQPPSWTDRGYVTASLWLQAPGSSFDGVSRPIDFAEPALVNTTYDPRAAPGFDVGGGVRIWRNLAAGVDVSRFSKTGNGNVSAQVPHPFYFNRARAVAGSASGLTRSETGIHAQLTWIIPIKSRWQLAIAGGPSWFMVDQDLVSDVTVTQAFPFDTAQFAGAVAARKSAKHAGFNTGADLTYLLRRRVGVGFGANYARATVPIADGVNLTAGGVRVGGGARFRF